MKEQDMTVGKPSKIILQFAVPVFIGNIFQMLYNMIDTIIVGKFVGTTALAAVGSTGTISFLIVYFLIGLTSGFTVLTAQRFGAGDMRGMRKTVGTGTILAVISCVIITVISMLCMKGLLNLMNTPADIYQDAYDYIMIICAGIFAQVLYNMLASILRALGNSKIPLYFLILSALLNIVLDLLLIITFHMGVSGAAYATVISQGVSGLLCLVYIIKKVDSLKMDKSDWQYDGHVAKLQISIGLPMALQFSITAVGTIMVQAALNTLGSLAVAAFTAANKIEMLATQAFVALGTAIATFCAQNIGAGKISRIRQGFRATTIMAIIYSLIASALVMTVGKYMSILFVSENINEIMSLVDVYLKCAGGFFIPLLFIFIYRNGIQGMGYALLPMMAGVFELVGRVVVAFVASAHKSFLGICLASPAAWLLAGVMLVVSYFFVMKKYKNYKE
jgi:putative MATE family efflux protein